MDKNWTNINERIFFQKEKLFANYHKFHTLYPRFINRFFMNVRYFQFSRMQWLEMMATKSVESKCIFRRDLATMGAKKYSLKWNGYFYRTFSNVNADFPVSRWQFRWHYWQSYGICFTASADTKRNIFKYSSRLYYYFSLYSLSFLC